MITAIGLTTMTIAAMILLMLLNAMGFRPESSTEAIYARIDEHEQEQKQDPS